MSIGYVDSLVQEYLIFRGFTATWQSFAAELRTDASCNFQVQHAPSRVFKRPPAFLQCHSPACRSV